MEQKNYYEILGVSPSASPGEIKKAYRKLAKEYHPDTHPGDKRAEAKFKEISQAYDILGKPEKRKQYDQMKAAFDQGFRPGGFDFSGAGNNWEDILRQAGQGREPRGRSFTFEDLGGLGGLGDIFSQFMDQGASFRQARAAPQKGRDLEAKLEIPFAQAMKGGKAKLTLLREDTCPACGGSGAAPGSRTESCPQCGGRGTVTITQGRFAVSRPCPHCYGRGTIISQPCSRCRGKGRSPARRTISLKIPAGVSSGTKLKLKGEGEAGPGGGPPGDLLVGIRVAPHPTFSRKGDRLYTRLSIDFATAALGGKVKVSTLTGSATLKIPPGTQPGTTFKLKGLGPPGAKTGRRGDLYVKVNVAVPQKLTPEQKESLKKFSS